MVKPLCEYCKKIMTYLNFVTGPNNLNVALHKMCEPKWREENKVDTYKFFTEKNNCTKCGTSLRQVHTFCHDCGRCPSCFTKFSKCNKVVIKQEGVTVENNDKFKPFESLQREYLKDNIKRDASLGEHVA